jgi:hypothetical protein
MLFAAMKVSQKSSLYSLQNRSSPFSVHHCQGAQDVLRCHEGITVVQSSSLHSRSSPFNVHHCQEAQEGLRCR